jgi:hypothetical protein
MVRRLTLKQLLEDAELRVQRAQQHRLDRQREAVAALEPADRDAAKRYLRILEKALAIHVADRDRLAKQLVDRG